MHCESWRQCTKAGSFGKRDRISEGRCDRAPYHDSSTVGSHQTWHMAKDTFHDVVKAALIKEGWTITHDPYEIAVGGVEMYIDLGAEQVIGAEQGEAKIAVEVKSFFGRSIISDFHTAHGQFLDYRYALEETEPERVLYLAVPENTYVTFFKLAFIQTAIRRSQLRLIVYDPDKEVITQWQ